jgi:hypothetical protein
MIYLQLQSQYIYLMTLSKAIYAAGRAHAGVNSKPGAAVDHLLSCDSDAGVRAWITSTHNPLILASNVQDLGLAVWDERLDEFMVQKPASMVVCGWVCHDACRA